MDKETFDLIEKLGTLISKELREKGNPHQRVEITQNNVVLLSTERGAPTIQPQFTIKDDFATLTELETSAEVSKSLR